MKVAIEQKIVRLRRLLCRQQMAFVFLIGACLSGIGCSGDANQQTGDDPKSSAIAAVNAILDAKGTEVGIPVDQWNFKPLGQGATEVTAKSESHSLRAVLDEQFHVLVLSVNNESLVSPP